MTALLTVRDLTVRHGAAVAVSGADLDVRENSVVGLIGPNGAGKTTCLDAVTGFARPVRGRIVFDGVDITDLPAHRRARRGLTRTFQALDLFEDLTVSANLAVAARTPTPMSTLRDAFRRRAVTDDSVRRALDLVGIADLGGRRPDRLSNGERHLVAVARALVSRPRLVLLDEPAAGLDESETAELAAVIRRLPDLGISVLLVDHDISFVLGVCDRIHVLDLGSVIASGSPAEIRDDPAVVAAYLGPGPALDPDGDDRPADRVEPAESGSADAAEATAPAAPDAAPAVELRTDRPEADARRTARDPGPTIPPEDRPPLLELRGLDAGHDGVRIVSGLDLGVRAGEIVALIGANGAGKTTTLQTISGLLPVLGGSIRFDDRGIGSPGRRINPGRAAELTRLGLVQVPEGRHLFTDLTVEEHLRVTAVSERSPSTADLLDRFPILASLRNRRAGLLSGGEQQQLALARALRAGPRILLIDELSLGLAPIVAGDLLEMVREIAADLGTGVLLVEQHVAAGLRIADSAVVLRRGRRVLAGTASEVAGRLDEVERSYLG